MLTCKLDGGTGDARTIGAPMGTHLIKWADQILLEWTAMTRSAHNNKRKAPPKSNVTRADGPCPIMRSCGGCEWLGLPYRKQLARKHAAMVELFEPLIESFGWNATVEPVLGMGPDRTSGPVTVADTPLASPRAFRHKAATPCAPGKGRAGNTVQSGFFARGTHDIIPCPACSVEAPGCRALLNEVAHTAEHLGIPAYDEDRQTGQLRYAVVRAGWRTDEMMLTLVTRTREVPHLNELAEALRAYEPRLVTVAQNINPRQTNAILGGETRILWGAERMADQLLDCTFEISPTSFYQVNPQQTEVLYRCAIDGMDPRGGDVVLDTYCGSGTIGLCAAVSAHAEGQNVQLVGVERNPQGIADARRNAEVNGMGADSPTPAQFIAQDATAYMQAQAAAGMQVDVLIMDPPRAGSTPEFLAAASELAPRRIVYISCNPATQVRDLEHLGRTGYRLLRVTPVDMFPHTAHVETVAVLELS